MDFLNGSEFVGVMGFFPAETDAHAHGQLSVALHEDVDDVEVDI